MWIGGYPKSGTTWMCHIIAAIDGVYNDVLRYIPNEILNLKYGNMYSFKKDAQ